MTGARTSKRSCSKYPDIDPASDALLCAMSARGNQLCTREESAPITSACVLRGVRFSVVSTAWSQTCTEAGVLSVIWLLQFWVGAKPRYPKAHWD
jgi:hypothetical protein